MHSSRAPQAAARRLTRRVPPARAHRAEHGQVDLREQRHSAGQLLNRAERAQCPNALGRGVPAQAAHEPVRVALGRAEERTGSGAVEQQQSRWPMGFRVPVVRGGEGFYTRRKALTILTVMA